jgi:hypothetical protein
MRFWQCSMVARSTGTGGGGSTSGLTSGLLEAECSPGIGFGFEKARRSPVALQTLSSSL